MSTQFTNRQWRLPNNENKDKQSNYSMDFDGSSQYIKTSTVAMTGNKSLSMWFKTTSVLITQGVFESQPVGGTSDYLVVWLQQSQILTSSSGSASASKKSSSLNPNTWYHLVITKSSGQIDKIYINGQDDTQTSTGYLAYINGRNFNYIGATYQGTGYDNEFLGQIDAVSIYNYALSSSQVTTLYGSSSTGIGNPMSLSPKPVAYYPLGDQDAFNGSNYLVPNIAAEEADGDIATSYSPYALDFDAASSDKIEVSNNTALQITGDITISAWVYAESQNGRVVSKRGGGGTNYDFYIESRYLRLYDGGTGPFSTGRINLNEWSHILISVNSGTGTYYINNAVAGTGTFSISSVSTSQPFYIGGSYTPVLAYFNGKLSNISIWNTALTPAQVTEIYNEGVPSNLNNHSAYSNLVSWWQLGSNSSFNTNWTVLDEKGSNNGTSANMGEDAIVDGVGSSC